MFPLDFSSQDSCDSAALFGGVMVALGVALEAVDLVEKIRNRNKSILPKESVCLLWVEFFSISLVVLGLWLEIFATHKSSVFARSKSDELSKQAQAASDKAATAEKDAGDSKVLAAKIGTTNAQLVADNLVLRSNVVALEAAVQWRTIKPAQQTNIVARLKAILKDNPKIMEKAVVTVDVDQLDVEAMWYARRLVNVLKMGGLNAKLDPAIYAYPPDSSPFVGLGFSGKPGSPQAGTIFAALRESGIVSNWAWEQPDWDETALSIRVGHKPEK